jgi:hypothetical protein
LKRKAAELRKQIKETGGNAELAVFVRKQSFGDCPSGTTDFAKSAGSASGKGVEVTSRPQI